MTENGKHNQISVDLTKIQSEFVSVRFCKGVCVLYVRISCDVYVFPLRVSVCLFPRAFSCVRASYGVCVLHVSVSCACACSMYAFPLCACLLGAG